MNCWHPREYEDHALSGLITWPKLVAGLSYKNDFEILELCSEVDTTRPACPPMVYSFIYLFSINVRGWYR